MRGAGTEEAEDEDTLEMELEAEDTERLTTQLGAARMTQVPPHGATAPLALPLSVALAS